MSDDMIERVARAVDIADGEFIVFYPGDPLESRASSKWSETIARAAIMAMRDPTPEMIAAANHGWDRRHPDESAPSDAWCVMIDAALERGDG